MVCYPALSMVGLPREAFPKKNAACYRTCFACLLELLHKLLQKQEDCPRADDDGRLLRIVPRVEFRARVNVRVHTEPLKADLPCMECNPTLVGNLCPWQKEQKQASKQTNKQASTLAKTEQRRTQSTGSGRRYRSSAATLYDRCT
jgi:hypothetical protein